VLLAGLQGEDVADAAVHIHGLPHDPPGHPTHVVEARGQDPQVRASEVEVVAEALPLRDGDVDAELARRREHPQRHRIEDLDRLRLRRGGSRRQLLDGLEDAERVGMLDDHARNIGVDRGGENAATAGLDPLRLVAGAASVGLECLDVARIDRLRDQDATALGGPRHVDGLDECGGAVVQGRVGDPHPRQLADHRLELEEDLQHALGQLRLVRGVGGEELGAPGQRPDDGGDVMVVRTGPREADQLVRMTVAARHVTHVRDELHLRDSVRKIQRAVEPDAGGHLREQIIERGEPQGGEHLSHVVVGVGREPHGREVYRRR